jgi:GNAT superfamily N-acetyltransferase
MNHFADDTLTIHTASTVSEIEETQKFRYQVYAKEMGLDLPGIDHARQMLVDPLDKGGTHLYARVGSQLVGAVRLNLNTVPAGLETALQMRLLPNPFVYCSRLYLREEWRGKGIMAELAKACFEHFIQQKAIAAICHCYPRLIKLYAGLGFRTYGSPFVVPGLEQLGAQSPLRCLLPRHQYVAA